MSIQWRKRDVPSAWVVFTPPQIYPGDERGRVTALGCDDAVDECVTNGTRPLGRGEGENGLEVRGILGKTERKFHTLEGDLLKCFWVINPAPLGSRVLPGGSLKSLFSVSVSDGFCVGELFPPCWEKRSGKPE